MGLTGGAWGMVAIGTKSETPAPRPPTYLVRSLLPTSVVVEIHVRTRALWRRYLGLEARTGPLTGGG